MPHPNNPGQPQPGNPETPTEPPAPGSFPFDDGDSCTPIETVDMPKHVALLGARPYVPPAGAQPELFLSEVLFDKAVKAMRRGLFEKGYGHEVMPNYSVVSGLVLMKHGVEIDAPAEVREDNAFLLPAAANSAITAAECTPDGAVMKLDVPATKQELGRIHSLERLHGALSWIPGVLRNNIAGSEQKLGGRIRTSVRRVANLAETDGPLRAALESALRWIQLPSKRAKETRREHERWIAQQETKAETKAGTQPGTDKAEKGTSEPSSPGQPGTPPPLKPHRTQ